MARILVILMVSAVLVVGCTFEIESDKATIVGRAYLIEDLVKWGSKDVHLHLDDKLAVGAAIELFRASVENPTKFGDYARLDSVTVGEDGHYRFEVEPGDYWVNVDVTSGPWEVRYLPATTGFQINSKEIKVGPILLLHPE